MNIMHGFQRMHGIESVVKKGKRLKRTCTFSYKVMTNTVAEKGHRKNNHIVRKKIFENEQKIFMSGPRLIISGTRLIISGPLENYVGAPTYYLGDPSYYVGAPR